MRDGTMTIEREYAPWPTATSALRATGAAVFVRAGLPPWRRHHLEASPHCRYDGPRQW